MNIFKSTRLSVESWAAIDWTKVQKKVAKSQHLIYEASLAGDYPRLRMLQRRLVVSLGARLLAVRQVTQDNKGRNTAGVDKVRKLKSAERLALARWLRIPVKASPLRRVWIPKPGKPEKRPLGIPTINDRCAQALMKLVIEPEWEARFEENSYGFRPGRNCHDALSAIRIQIQQKPKYVFDADIAKCFDRINHDALLDKCGYKGKFRRQLRYWLKSGVVDDGIFQETNYGTPQGGVISPLLANIALHGMETYLRDYAATVKMKFGSGKWKSIVQRRNSLGVIRYADDFVIMHESKDVVLACVDKVKEFLSLVGLEISETKSRLTHTLELLPTDIEPGFDGKVGFNFLGFTVKQWRTTHASATSTVGGKKKLGFRTLIIPTKESVEKHQKRLHDVILKNGKSLNQNSLIKILNPIIVGWSRYAGVSDAATMDILGKMDYLLYLKLRKWAKRKTGNAKGKKYWRRIGSRKWVFSEEGGLTLASHTKYSLPINDYAKVRGRASPYDGQDLYWATRLKRSRILAPRVTKLLALQEGYCRWCGLRFKEGEVMEVDHIYPTTLGGKDTYDNLQLLHRHCHDAKTRTDGSLKQASPNKLGPIDLNQGLSRKARERLNRVMTEIEILDDIPE